MAEGGHIAIYTFITMIVWADKDGLLTLSPKMLGKRMGLPDTDLLDRLDFFLDDDYQIDDLYAKHIWKEFYKAISLLEAPDPDSNLPEMNGRRIIPLKEMSEIELNRGWLIVNYKYYRDLGGKARKDYMADYMREYRKHGAKSRRESVNNGKPNVNISKPKVKHTDTDTDSFSSSKKEEECRNSKVPPCPHEKIRELYNMNCKSLPTLLKLSKQRKQRLQVRWREHPDLQWWIKLFQKVEETPFCCGDNDRGWKASFDWLIANDTNALKVLEGKYDEPERKKKSDGLVGCKTCTMRSSAATMDLNEKGICYACRAAGRDAHEM